MVADVRAKSGNAVATGPAGYVAGGTIGRITIGVLGAYLVLLAVKLAIYDLNVTRFIAAGDRFFSVPDLSHPVAVQTASTGYDGQFFYRAALDPFTTKRSQYGITFDNPVVRMQRIVYPAIVWALSLGRGAAVPYLLVAVNLLGLAGLCLVGAGLTRAFRLPMRFAALVPLYPGFVITFTRDTSEIIASLFALAAMLGWIRERYVVGACCAALAVLTRETTLLYFVGFGLFGLVATIRQRHSHPLLIAAPVPLIVLAAWQVVLYLTWNLAPINDLGPHDLQYTPVIGYVEELIKFTGRLGRTAPSFQTFYNFLSCVSFGIFICYALLRVARSPHTGSAFTVPVALYCTLLAFFSQAVWMDPNGFVRVLCDTYLVIIVALMAQGASDRLRVLLPAVAGAWFVTALYVL